MFPDWTKAFAIEIDESVFNKLAQNEKSWKNEWQQNFKIHEDVTANPGLKPRRDI